MVQRRYVITPPDFCSRVMGTKITDLLREAHLLILLRHPQVQAFSDAFKGVLLGNRASGIQGSRKPNFRQRLSGKCSAGVMVAYAPPHGEQKLPYGYFRRRMVLH